MATFAVQRNSRAGLNPARAAAMAAGDAGDALPNTGHMFLRVKSAHAATAGTVTVALQLPAGAIAQVAAWTNLAVSVPALGERGLGPFDPASLNDANGRVVVTYDAEADLTVGAHALLRRR